MQTIVTNDNNSDPPADEDFLPNWSSQEVVLDHLTNHLDLLGIFPNLIYSLSQEGKDRYQEEESSREQDPEDKDKDFELKGSEEEKESIKEEEESNKEVEECNKEEEESNEEE